MDRVLDMAVLEIERLIVYHILLRQDKEVAGDERILLDLLLGAHESHASLGDGLVTFEEDWLESCVVMVLLEARLKREDKGRVRVHFELADDDLD